jgi:hypothetical protein
MYILLRTSAPFHFTDTKSSSYAGDLTIFLWQGPTHDEVIASLKNAFMKITIIVLVQVLGRWFIVHFSGCFSSLLLSFSLV